MLKYFLSALSGSLFLPKRLNSAHGGGAPEPFQGAVQKVVQPQAAGPGLKEEDGDGRAQACPRPHGLRQAQPPPEEQEGEDQRLGDVARQRAFAGAAEQPGGKGKAGMGEEQDGGGDEGRRVGEVFPLVQEVPGIRSKRETQPGGKEQTHSQQSQKQGSGDFQHPQEQAALVGRVLKDPPSARQHAQDEEAQRLPEAAAEQEELPFARLAPRQVPQGRLSPAPMGVQEFPRGTGCRGRRLEPAGGMRPDVRHPGAGQCVQEGDGLQQAQHAEDDQKRGAASVQGHQGKTQNAEDGEDVSVIKEGVRQPQQEQQRQPPHETLPEVDAFLFLPVQLDEEAEAEQEGEEKEGFADKKVFIGPVRHAVGRGLPSLRRGDGKVQVEMVVRVDDDDAQQGQGPEDVQDGDARRPGGRSGGGPGRHDVRKGGKGTGSVPPRAAWPTGPLPEWEAALRGDLRGNDHS